MDSVDVDVIESNTPNISNVTTTSNDSTQSQAQPLPQVHSTPKPKPSPRPIPSGGRTKQEPIVQWLYEKKGFQVIDMHKFVAIVLPRYFKRMYTMYTIYKTMCITLYITLCVCTIYIY